MCSGAVALTAGGECLLRGAAQRRWEWGQSITLQHKNKTKNLSGRGNRKHLTPVKAPVLSKIHFTDMDRKKKTPAILNLTER